MEHYVIRPASQEENQAVHTGLRAYNRNYVPDSADLSLAVTDETGTLIGGCDAFRLGELVFLDALWVAEDHRGSGLGALILGQLEENTARQGAVRIELNTFSFQAPGFYEKLGYRCCGAIEPATGEFGHYFYVKQL